MLISDEQYAIVRREFLVDMESSSIVEHSYQLKAPAKRVYEQQWYSKQKHHSQGYQKDMKESKICKEYVNALAILKKVDEWKIAASDPMKPQINLNLSS